MTPTIRHALWVGLLISSNLLFKNQNLLLVRLYKETREEDFREKLEVFRSFFRDRPQLKEVLNRSQKRSQLGGAVKAVQGEAR
jgi:hypothetical protein